MTSQECRFATAVSNKKAESYYCSCSTSISSASFFFILKFIKDVFIVGRKKSPKSKWLLVVKFEENRRKRLADRKELKERKKNKER